MPKKISQLSSVAQILQAAKVIISQSNNGTTETGLATLAQLAEAISTELSLESAIAAISQNTANVAELLSANASVVREYSATRSSSHNGVDYVETNGVFDIHGTATSANSVFGIEGYTDRVPDWVEPGEYYIEFSKHDRTDGVTPVTDDVRLQMILYYSDESNKVVFASEEGGRLTLTDELLSDDLVGAYIRFVVNSGATADSKCTVRILSAPSNSELTTLIEKNTETLEKIIINLYEVESESEYLKTAGNWVFNSSFSSVSGAVVNNATGYCRTLNRLRGKNSWRFSLGELAADYKFNVLMYDANAGNTFIGPLKKQYDDKDVITPVIRTVDNGVESFGLYGICICRKDGQAMNADSTDTTSDAYKIINAFKRYGMTDNTLEKTSVPADAEAVGAALSEIKQDNAAVVMKYSATKSSTHNGIEYVETNGVFDIHGTATGSNSVCGIQGGPTAIPDWITPGEYYLELNKYDRTDGITPATDDVRIQLVLYYSDESSVVVLNSEEGGKVTLTDELVNEDLVGAYLRFITNVGTSANSKCIVRVMNAPSNKELMKRIDNADPLFLRVMQYNAGKWRFGITSDDPINEAKFQTVIPNYRRFFAKYRPDIVGMEEYIPYMCANDTHDAATELFNPLYAEAAPKVRVGSEETKIYTNFKTQNSRVLWKNITEGGTTHYSCFTVTEVMAGRKKIGVAAGYLSSANGGTNMRLQQMQYLLGTVMSQYDYAIILMDVNASYYFDNNGDPVAVKDDNTCGHKQIVDLAKTFGYTACNELGGFWGATKSYLQQYSNISKEYYMALDEIFVRGNIKVRNFEVCKDAQHEIENSDPTKYNYVDKEILNRQAGDPYVWLASDHLPVIADLVIY